MLTSEYLFNLAGLASFLTIAALTLALYLKMGQIKQLHTTVNKLQRSLNEMDEQAKLIVRTDIELNRTQEELDKKIIGLYALQRLSRAISATMEENQIFKMIGPAYLEELGLEKACALLWSQTEKRFLLTINIGYSQDEAEAIKAYANSNKDRYLELIKSEAALSSITPALDIFAKEEVNRIFKVESFIISPILPKEGNRGLLFVGTQSLDTLINEGDEELITILANQLGQAIENARLFEKTWRAHQDLERKVEERTRDLKVALDELKNISNRKTDFVSSVSHELRTPLTSIKGYASILLAGKLGDLPSDIRERLDKINRHSDELVHLVDDLLDIARIESGRMTMAKEPLVLKNIIEGVSDLLSAQLKENHIELSFNIAPEANAIFADRNQIERIFINVIDNAIKFSPQKGKIIIEAHKEKNDVQIDITDTGCGIPEEALEKIFEEFYRVDNPINQETKGTGLGLALVKRIVQTHNGKIWVKSKVGNGSTFSFTIPS
jgi:signal transduction histidine kinase